MNRHWVFLVPLMFLLTACGAEPNHVTTWPEVVQDTLPWLGLIGVIWVVNRG